MKASEIRAIAAPGGITHHQVRLEVVAPASRESSSILPHVTTVGSPRPRKLNAASPTIAVGTDSARLTYVRETMLAKMCWVRIWPVPPPEALAASMKGLSRRLSTCERIILAKP